MRKQWLVLLVAVLASAMLWGCGSSGGSGGSDVTQESGFETLGITNCAQCHSLYNEKWLASPHGNPDLSPGGDDPHTVESSCAICHNPLDDGSLMPAAFNETMRDVVGCESCHGGGDAHRGLGPIAYTLPGPSQCGACHNVETEADYHATSTGRIINDTHFDNPETANIIEGYVVKLDEQTGCQDCHFDGHNLDMTINNEWADSAHAGHLMTFKTTAEQEAEGAGATDEEILAAVLIAGVQDTDDGNSAWAHYDWDQTTGYDSDTGEVSVAEGRGDCQACHTATGATTFLNDPSTYDPLNNDFSHLSGWDLTGGENGETISSGQNEIIGCSTCHVNINAGMRNPGAIPLSFTFNEDIITLPDLGSSNVCANCHAGRGNMDTLISEATDDSGDFTGAPATQTHYFNAAATIFQSVVHPGYEYTNAAGDTLDYTDVGYYAHNKVGIPEGRRGPDPEEGPCAGCHMSEVDTDTGENEYATHNFEIYTKNDAGTITALNSSKCVECHDGGYGTALAAGTSADALDLLNEEAEGYHEALEILEELLATELGAFFAPSYPYFFIDTNGNGELEELEAIFPNQFRNWDNLGNNGAAHNYNYLHHEPGAYAHNRIYAKRLIFDSIDWLDNGVLDGSITIDATTYPEADAWLASGAARP